MITRVLRASCLAVALGAWAGIGTGSIIVARAGATEIGPDSDLCRTLRTLPVGEELVLKPGTYAGPCAIRRGGTSGAPLVIRAKDPLRPPRIVYTGDRTNVVEVYASHVVLRGLEFGPTRPEVDAVRIRGADDVTVEDCLFTGVGGIAVVANHASSRGLVVRGNVIRNSRATALYFGCHDGALCRIADLLVERNYIGGVTAAEAEVGYGLEVKLNSTAVVRDNVVVDTKGPGIMIYGAWSLTDGSTVERNFVAGSRRSSGIVIGGGPVVVRNNIAVRNAVAGIGLEDYGRRGLLRNIVIAYNTVQGNLAGGIAVATPAREITIVNNAVSALAGTPGLPAARGGVTSEGNVDCSLIPCFRDPLGSDFSPLALGTGAQFRAPWVPTRDYLGRPRGSWPTVGALQSPAPPIVPGLKPSVP